MSNKKKITEKEKKINYLTGNTLKVDDRLNSSDVASRYLRDNNRTIFLTGEINQDTINKVIIEMKYLEAIDPKKDIKLYIDSYGGEVASCFALCDFISTLKCDVATYALGVAMSAGAVILSSGTKGKRYVQEHTNIMIHPVQHMDISVQRSFPDHRIDFKYTEVLNNILITMLSKNCGIYRENIKRDIDRDFYLFGEEAVEYGLADKVIKTHE